MEAEEEAKREEMEIKQAKRTKDAIYNGADEKTRAFSTKLIPTKRR